LITCDSGFIGSNLLNIFHKKGSTNDCLVNGEVESGIYNIADDKPLSTNHIIKLIGESLGKKPLIWNFSRGFINFLAKVGDLLHLPLNSLRLKKLTQNYVVSNVKIKKALGISCLPVSVKEGMQATLRSF